MASANVEIIERLYAAFGGGDIPAALELISPDVVWSEAENFPYGDRSPYIGPQAVLDGVFARLGAEWDGWTVHMEAVHDAGDTVVVRGRYAGTCKATGKSVNPQVAHVWTLADGKVVAFQQYVDTLQVAEAMRG